MLAVSLMVWFAALTTLMVDGIPMPDVFIPPCPPPEDNRDSIRVKEIENEIERSRLPCPPNAFCADEWNTIRDYHNGTRCRDHSLIYNCRCPGDRECPRTNHHVFFANDKHKRFTCESTCSVEPCGRNMKRNAVVMVRNDPVFNGNTFYKVNCRCPGHMFPMTSRPGELVRATRYRGIDRDYTKRPHIVKTYYQCSPGIGWDFDDPCVDGERDAALDNILRTRDISDVQLERM